LKDDTKLKSINIKPTGKHNEVNMRVKNDDVEKLETGKRRTIAEAEEYADKFCGDDGSKIGGGHRDNAAVEEAWRMITNIG